MHPKIYISTFLSFFFANLFSQATKEVSASQFPCQGGKYESDKTAYRGAGYAESSDLTIARDKALILAKEALANSIKSQINSTTSLYLSSKTTSSISEFKQEFESINNESVDETLEGVIVICQKQERIKGNINKFWIACEIGTMPVINKIEEKIYSSKSLKIDFDKERFEKIFNSELEKLSNNK